MPFDEDYAKYQRCLIASSIDDKDLISFSNRVRSHTGCTIRNLNTKITLGPFSQSGLKKLGNKDFKQQAALIARLFKFKRDFNRGQRVALNREYFSLYGLELALKQKFLTEDEYEIAERLFCKNADQWTDAEHSLHFKLLKMHILPFIKAFLKERKAKLKDSIPFSETTAEIST